MKRVVSIILAVLVLSAFTAYAFSERDHCRYEKSHWWGKSKVLEQLELTEQQKTKIDEITTSNEEMLDNLHKQLRTSYKEFRKSMLNPDSTRDEILSMYDQVEKNRRELTKVKIGMTLEMREILSPEQRTKLFDIKEQHWKDRNKKDE